MTASKKVREFKERDEYFCIRSAFQVFLTGDPKGYKYYLCGLGTDDKLYKYTPKGWIQL